MICLSRITIIFGEKTTTGDLTYIIIQVRFLQCIQVDLVHIDAHFVDAIWTRRYTYFSAKKIVEEIDHYVDKYGIDGIYFREDLFTANHKRLREVCDLLIERPYSINWACEARADITDKGLIEKMYEIGCRGMYLGVESGNDEGLKKKKGFRFKYDEDFFKHANEIDLATYATFCIGTPGETEAEINATEDFIEEVKPTPYDKFAYLGLLRKKSGLPHLLATNDYYHIDAGKIVYSDTFYEMAHRLYDEKDQKAVFS